MKSRDTMKVSLLLPLWIVGLSFGCQSIKTTKQLEPDWKYEILSKLGETPRHLQISVRFTGEADGSTLFFIPNKWASEQEYYKGIQSLKAIGNGVSLEQLDTPHRFRIRHAPSQSIVVTYTVSQYWDQPVSHAVYYRPIFQPKYFHFIGKGVFAHPESKNETKKTIKIVWKGIPQSWQLANSFGVERRRYQIIRASLSEFTHSVFVGGDFTIKRFFVKEHPVFVALRGKWQFSTQEYVSLVRTVVNSVRTFWNDFEFPFFLITMIPLDDRCCSRGGTGLSNSFATFVSKGLPSLDELKHLLTHELFHTWNGRKIKREEPEELVYWFAEGFTNYYTRLINLRSGLISLEEYVTDYNTVIADYFVSPARNESNSKIVAGFWKDRYVKELPYKRGDILAHTWNLRLKNNSPFTLDTVMHNILKAAVEKNVRVSAASFENLTPPPFKKGIRDDITRFIEKRATIPIAKDALGPCVRLKMVKKHIFDLGFDLKSIKRKRFKGVRRDGFAYRAGLREGQNILASSVYWGKPEKRVRFKIRDQKGSRWISFFPKGKAMTIPQYYLDPETFEHNRSQCLAWFGIDIGTNN